uniref:HAP1 N-terminal domain-containing protein n=1 Tax=Dracunculus medinensis TaxID=318479 RepID=A0A0N4U1C6_DRAME
LKEQYAILKTRNEELEERILNVVEKVESDKLTLSDEIDHLITRISSANSKILMLESECARYKRDCILAVHLLHCQPSHYIAKEKAPEGLFSDDSNEAMKVVSRVATFPPMAIFLPDNIDGQPEDPSPSACSLGPEFHGKLKTSASFSSNFVDQINANEDYSCVEVRRCAKCTEIVTQMSRETQTSCPLPPRPVIIDIPAWSTSASHENI